ncbi:TM2 domain-containing protein [Ketobacter sp. MCCC 1A13808]|nr:TM2 domain-containing protein [Ketobacter sp. MCCC 1A13808]
MITLWIAFAIRSAKRIRRTRPLADIKKPVSKRKILPALLLCLIFGYFGTHRFYVGKVGTGMLQMLTLGGLGLWMLYDAIVLVLGKFCDCDNAALSDWT